MKIFPHILSRIGGETFDVWGQVDLTELKGCIASLTNSQKERQASKEILTADLLEYIRTLTDTRHQNVLQNFRRDIFNERPLKAAALDSCKQLLTPVLCAGVDHYLKLCDLQAQLLSQYSNTFNNTLVECRKHLQALSNNESLRKGLLLSSRTLFDSLNSFRLADASQFRNKEARIEESLIKYMTRITTKTSPFSTFNNLAPGSLVENRINPIQIKTMGNAGIDSTMLLNNYIYQYLRDLFMAWKPFFLQLHLRVNPTIIYNSDHYLFLTNSRNTEAFQRIPLSPVISYILETVGEFVEGIRFRDLVSKMMEDIDASAEDLESHVKRLLDLGLLEFAFGVSGIDPKWDIALIEKLKTFDTTDVPLVIELIDVLQRLRTIAEEVGQVDSAGREGKLAQAYKMLRDICLKIHEAAGLPEKERKDPEPPKEKVSLPVEAKPLDDTTPRLEEFHHVSATNFYLKPEQIFYEDTLRKITPEIDHSMLNELIGAFSQLVEDSSMFNGQRTDREKIASFLKENNAQNVPIPLLTFYELYSRETRKEDEEKQKLEEERKKQGENAAPVQNEEQKIPASTRKRFERMRSWNEHLHKMITPLVPEAGGEVRFTHQHIKELCNVVGLESNDDAAPNSFSVFTQLFVEYDENGLPRLKGTLNGNLPGYGKMLSRFLHMLPANVVNDIREWNGMLNEDDNLLIEDTDASFFNANLHPPLLKYEIRTPGGHNALPPQQQLPLSDFVVTVDERTETPALIHKPTGKRSYVFDLGFQGQLGRSGLFRILNKFSTSDFPGATGSLNVINVAFESKQTAQDPEKKRIIHRPRIVYEDRMVLQRKGWLIDKSLLPFRKPNEVDSAYYLRIQHWREANSIDAHVFVCANPTLGKKVNDNDSMKKLGRDDYKPQYIDLTNPIFINLFEKLMEKVPKALKIEEMLPSPDHLLKIDDKRFVTEYIVHWYNFKHDAKSVQSIATSVAVGAG